MNYILVLLFCSLNMSLFSQVIKNYNSEAFKFIGTNENEAVFLCRKISG